MKGALRGIKLAIVAASSSTVGQDLSAGSGSNALHFESVSSVANCLRDSLPSANMPNWDWMAPPGTAEASLGMGGIYSTVPSQTISRWPAHACRWK